MLVFDKPASASRKTVEPETASKSMRRKANLKEALMLKLKRYAGLSAVALFSFYLPMLNTPAGRGQHPTVMSGNPVSGRNVFINRGCIKCHSVRGYGGKIGPDLSRIGMGKSFLQIAGSLWNHASGMSNMMQLRGVARPSLTPEEMSNLIFYLYYLNYDERGDVIAGRNLFSQKGCINCHSVRGTGSRVGPPLDNYQKYSEPLSVAQAMWNHSPRMTAKMAELGINSPEFKTKEMGNLLAFISTPAARQIPNRKSVLTGDPSSGRRLFAQKGCARCHSINGRRGAEGPDLASDRSYQSITDVAGAMWNHRLQMSSKMQQAGIARPTFSGNEMADIIAYIYLARYTDKRGDAARGERLFVEKGCAECHSLGQGQKVGPDLSASGALSSPASLMAAMWNHAPEMERVAQERGLSWPKLEGDEMRDMVEYIKFYVKASAKK